MMTVDAVHSLVVCMGEREWKQRFLRCGYGRGDEQRDSRREDADDQEEGRVLMRGSR